MAEAERKGCIRDLRAEYEDSPAQRKLQELDSANLGDKRMKERKRSRFAREWQRRAGSKQGAELVIFSGRWDAELLKRAVSGDDATRPAHDEVDRVAVERKERVKKAAIDAKCRLRQGRHLARQKDEGAELDPQEEKMLELFACGDLRRRANRAIIAHGHGRLRKANGTFVDIGGSTGGIVRKILDDFVPPSPQEFCTD